MVKYKVIAQVLEEEIKRGKYVSRALPSETQLGRRFDVGRQTAQKALLELQQKGLVVRRQGKGSFLTKRAKCMTGLCGLLIPDASSGTALQTLSAEIARVGQNAGYTFLLGSVAINDSESAVEQTLGFAREFVRRRVEGVIFRPFLDERLESANRQILDVFRSADVPVVLIDSDAVQSPRRSEFDVIGVDNVSGGRRTARHLIEAGRKNLAFLLCNFRSAVPNINWRNRMFGVAGAVVESGGSWSGINVLDVSPDDEQAWRKVFRRKFRPDAIVCGSDEIAVILMRTLDRIGKSVPGDVAVAGFDDMEIARLANPPLTTVRQPFKDIAGISFRTLMERIRNPEAPTRGITVDAPLVVRGSTSSER